MKIDCRVIDHDGIEIEALFVDTDWFADGRLPYVLVYDSWISRLSEIREDEDGKVAYYIVVDGYYVSKTDLVKKKD